VEKFFYENGWNMVTDFRRADLIIFRTCALREASEKRSLEIVRKIKMEKKKDARLIVWGCLPKINPEALKQEYNDITFGEREIEVLNEIVGAVKPIQEISANYVQSTFKPPRKGAQVLFGKILDSVEERFEVTKVGSSMFLIKVATGCLGRCTFCAVRRSRGAVRSKSVTRIMNEFSEGLASGSQHFGLLATDLGAYGRDQGNTLVDLLNEMTKKPGDYHIGLRNINPHYFIEMFEDLKPILQSGKILFLSSAVESGSNRILELMGREYKIEDFKRCIKTLNTEYPSILLRTQIMVGFPTETEHDFQESMQILDDLTFDWVEVYKFSPRPGTIASDMDGQVPGEMKEARFRKFYAKSLLKHPRKKVDRILRSYF
jgi:MiaB/RimO family radical SAM methylthiotransferase